MAILESAAFWIIVAAASELIALSPLKDNSIIQLVLHALKSMKGKKWLTTRFVRPWTTQLLSTKTHYQNLQSYSQSSLRKVRLARMAGVSVAL